MWANVWAAVSAFASVLTLMVAVWALLRWRKQDELKAKLEFKQGIARLAYCLSRMPIKLTLPERDKSSERLAELKAHMSQCTYAWLVSEGLMDGYPDVKKNWDYINTAIDLYYWGRITSDEIGECCAAILLQKFVFK